MLGVVLRIVAGMYPGARPIGRAIYFSTLSPATKTIFSGIQTDLSCYASNSQNVEPVGDPGYPQSFGTLAGKVKAATKNTEHANPGIRRCIWRGYVAEARRERNVSPEQTH
jgi:hypothetical protein